MGAETKIEWCDRTWSPWFGCTNVSPACDHCYAEAWAKRFGVVEWGAGKERRRASDDYWKRPIRWNKEAAAKGVRLKVFPSLCDPFDNEVDPAWRRDLFTLVEATPHLTWLLLTKRIGNVLKMTGGRVPCNVAIGATIANQDEYDRDRMKLWEVKLQLSPAFTFGSFEPLLSPIILDKHAPDWCIVGGETDQGAHKARHMPAEWAFRLLRQTRELGRHFFMKQMTNKAPIPAGLMVREFPT